MKIKNTKKNVEISSATMVFGSYNGQDVFVDEHFEEMFYAKDGWREVRENKWHDLRLNPSDLPKHDGWVWVYCKWKGHERYVQARFFERKYWRHYNCTEAKGVVAWKEFPDFTED
jgi:hypothetical protein